LTPVFRAGAEYAPRVPSKRRRAWAGFAFCAALAIVGLFVLHGAAAGIALLATMLVFIGVCIYALRGQDGDAVTRNERTGLAGWFGGWF
jgi:hypothetical protein